MLTGSLDSFHLHYKPKEVRWLFVGESPPTNGTFFFKADSNLSRYTQEAFSIAFKLQFVDGRELLDFFKSLGCYLIDLCTHPINPLSRHERKRCRKACAASLPELMAEYSPQRIIVVMKGIAGYVKSAVKPAGLALFPFTLCPSEPWATNTAMLKAWLLFYTV